MEDGRWVTINGNHVFVKDGQSPMDAFIRQQSNNAFRESEKNYKKYLGEEVQDLKSFVKNKYLTYGTVGDLKNEYIKIHNKLLDEKITAEQRKEFDKKMAQISYAIKKSENISLDDGFYIQGKYYPV